ncbi:MAG: hypothetical protein JWQ35_75 [Bacteriovoracaceae bacterium]|nr:hypothetical protein [Bacteriovoracaceae bacterium]
MTPRKFFLGFCALLTLSAEAAQPSKSCTAVAAKLSLQHEIQILKGSEFLQDKKYPYLKKFLNSLVRPDAGALKKVNWPSINLDKVSSKFKYGPIRLVTRLFQNKSENESNIVLVLEFYLSNRLVGFVARTIKKLDGERTAYGEGAYFNQSVMAVKGIIPTVQYFLDENFYRPLLVKVERLKADYIGRYVWAKRGFDFDPTYWFKDLDGTTYKLLQMARINLSRFLKVHKIKTTDLLVSTESRSHSIFSLDELKTAADFANLRHKRGFKIEIMPLIGGSINTVTISAPLQKMDIGKAFMLSDYGPGKEFIKSKARVSFSAYAMPYWNGFRKISER